MNLFTETLGYGLHVAIKSDNLIACLLNSVLKDPIYILYPFHLWFSTTKLPVNVAIVYKHTIYCLHNI